MKKPHEYKPKPFDTSNVVIPEDLEKLTEFLALNVHELWSQDKILEGWKYGDIHDNISKETPNLVPYDALPDHIKEYDRKTAMGTLKLIIALGYHIKKNS
ncbi:MAG: RyR domain-containing protein [Candidatus Hodarchaeales archaeon]|jgi:hypothetical protein